ncbi:nucleoside hydrolase-like [Saccoglossus kowalevskii]|uniref:Uncharacterized protein C1683.06c-like n=1 Tax=Saccoglossus kowalevskii TaxID=10224 RepID=A0ABM0GLZ1_SACKO|nr:PREDICTED: uncharacterized protein C1683.06c-like [Saccoglossus kowalevskii]
MADRIQMWIDCDPGNDDAEAIMVALSLPNVDVLGISCVNGNANVDQCCRNTLRVLRACGREEIPVFRGSTLSLLDAGDCIPDSAHGIDALGDAPDVIIPDMSLLKPEHGVNALVKAVNQHPGEISLVALGPLTSVAMAVRMDADFRKKVKDLTVMGGNTNGRGNITLCGEFNFAMDPEAACIVLNSMECPILILTADICEEHPLTQTWMKERLSVGTEKAKFVSAISVVLIKYSENIYGLGKDSPYICWDSLAMVARLCKDAIVESVQHYATVELHGKLTRGQMVVDWYDKLNKPKNVNIIKKLNMDIIKEMLIQSVK